MYIDLTTLTPLSLLSLGALGKPYSKVWKDTGRPNPPSLLENYDVYDINDNYNDDCDDYEIDENDDDGETKKMANTTLSR